MPALVSGPEAAAILRLGSVGFRELRAVLQPVANISGSDAYLADDIDRIRRDEEIPRREVYEYDDQLMGSGLVRDLLGMKESAFRMAIKRYATAVVPRPDGRVGGDSGDGANVWLRSAVQAWMGGAATDLDSEG